MAEPWRVAIVGGGISGLSAAWRLERAAAARGLAVDYALFERSERLGGKILSERVAGGFVVEGGPDAFLTQKPWAVQLAREVGLGERLIGTNDQQRTTYVLDRGRPTPLPEGVMLMVPTKVRPFLRTPLISWPGKLRMGLEWLIPPRRDEGDETLADFVRRRLGAEALQKIAEPLMAGIYNADAEQQSLLATFPRFRTLEQEHGSLLRAMLAAKRPAAPAAAPRLSTFVSFPSGAQELVEALERQLHGPLHRGVGCDGIEPQGQGYRLALSDGTSHEADALLLTLPAAVAASLLTEVAPGAVPTLRALRTVSTGTITLAFRESEIARPLHGFGMVIPTSEQRPINAITVSSTKFAHRAPAGYVLLRLFFGGARSPASMALDDAALLAMARAQLELLLGIRAEPHFHRIFRYWDANPQYDLGHLERVAAIEDALPPTVRLSGSAYRGVGVPDCIHAAGQAVDALMVAAAARAA